MSTGRVAIKISRLCHRLNNLSLVGVHAAPSLSIHNLARSLTCNEYIMKFPSSIPLEPANSDWYGLKQYENSLPLLSNSVHPVSLKRHIMDIDRAGQQVSIDCPNNVHSLLNDIFTPSSIRIENPVSDPKPTVDKESPGQMQPEKQTKCSILTIRRKKMNRHKLKKRRKKFKFLYRKIRQRRLKKKEQKLQEEVESIRAWGKKYDALQEVKDNLAQARKAGYHMEIFK
ncbi:hypothetical protein CHS0354_027235 [Potamilus streckersoni]|uniref:Small ribosomal subunit protein mS38 n=1 Tax=Potamilus streckersoni TaxID=2493646 RepID=A0AAE0RQZ7_9BIVA|nr:hypothetical protein CHS0354_027235 [Potamilus streckersoni]